MITQEQLNEIGQSASQEAIICEDIVNQFRERFPDIHFTYCMDDDVVVANPVYEHDAFNLYLIDSREHCLCFTQEMDIATGIVVAEIIQE